MFGDLVYNVITYDPLDHTRLKRERLLMRWVALKFYYFPNCLSIQLQ
jgi:hypothetical protein